MADQVRRFAIRPPRPTTEQDRATDFELLFDLVYVFAITQDVGPLKGTLTRGDLPVTHGGIVGQVWRSGSRQARLATVLAGMDVRPLDRDLGRAAGALLGRTRTADIIDAALALLAVDGDEIITSDRDDFEILVAATGQHIELVAP